MQERRCRCQFSRIQSTQKSFFEKTRDRIFRDVRVQCPTNRLEGTKVLIHVGEPFPAINAKPMDEIATSPLSKIRMRSVPAMRKCCLAKEEGAGFVSSCRLRLFR